jgi:hypothetical protein
MSAKAIIGNGLNWAWNRFYTKTEVPQGTAATIKNHVEKIDTGKLGAKLVGLTSTVLSVLAWPSNTSVFGALVTYGCYETNTVFNNAQQILLNEETRNQIGENNEAFLNTITKKAPVARWVLPRIFDIDKVRAHVLQKTNSANQSS